MLNKIIEFSLNNRLLVAVISALILVLGVYSVSKMEVDVFPDLNAPTVVVLTEAPGMAPEEVKLTQKHDFVQKHLEGLHKELFSLADCDMSTAREFIRYLIDFVLEFDVPLKIPIMEVVDDVQKYVYACLLHKKCAVCGQKAELHHVDRVGMGNNRNEIMHIGRQCLPLCRTHHIEIDHRGDIRFCEQYHLEPVEIDDKISKIYRLRGNKK